MRPRFLAGEVWNGLRRSASMAISIVLVSAVSLFFLGVGLLAERQVEAAKGFWYDKVEVSIFLCTARSSEPNCKGGAVSPPQRMVVETVKAYEYEDQQTAYQRFREQFKNNPVFADTPADAIPAAFRVQLTDPKDYQQINTAFAGVPGVGAVKDIRQVLEPLFKVLDFLRYAAWGPDAPLHSAADRDNDSSGGLQPASGDRDQAGCGCQQGLDPAALHGRNADRRVARGGTGDRKPVGQCGLRRPVLV